MYEPAHKWIPASLLNTSNFYGGPDGQPTPEGLLVRFGGILLEPRKTNCFLAGIPSRPYRTLLDFQPLLSVISTVRS
jgi:hypothetical protein